MNVEHTTTWTCAAKDCGAQETQRRDEWVCQALDQSMPALKPSLPDGWREVEGLAYCPNHEIHVTARVRTPTLLRINGRFVAGYAEELVNIGLWDIVSVPYREEGSNAVTDCFGEAQTAKGYGWAAAKLRAGLMAA